MSESNIYFCYVRDIEHFRITHIYHIWVMANIPGIECEMDSSTNKWGIAGSIYVSYFFTRERVGSLYRTRKVNIFINYYIRFIYKSK